MEATTIPCLKCKAALSVELFAHSPAAVCGSCGTPITAYLFPAFSHNTISTLAPQDLLMDSEASCFFHPQKKAALACEGCGRFLCGLCEMEWQGQHLCPQCLETWKKKGKMKSLENHRVLYDQIALSLSIIPVLMWPFTFLTAPAVVYMVIRHWNAPLSIVSRSKFRFVVALLLALAQIVGWIWLIATLAHRASK